MCQRRECGRAHACVYSPKRYDLSRIRFFGLDRVNGIWSMPYYTGSVEYHSKYTVTPPVIPQP